MFKNADNIRRFYRLFFKLILISVGLALVGLGVALMHKSTLGSSPVDTLSSGISKNLNISLGTSSMIIYIILFIPCVLFARDTIKIGTLLATLSQGFYIDFFYNLIPNISYDEYTWLKYLVSFSGIIICSFGISFYVSVNEGLAPLEGVTELLSTKLKWNYRNAKIITDLCLLIVGIILDGVYGLGTLMSVLCLGAFIQFFRKNIDIYFKRLIDA